MRVITGNDLPSGDVVWWTGEGWSRHVEQAAAVGADGEAIAKREEAALRVNIPYLVDAAPGPHGPVPSHIKERIRAAGPTVRPDLGIAAPDSGAGNWVI